MGDLVDDLAHQIHEYLLEEATPFQGGRLVLLPITTLVKRFEKIVFGLSKGLTIRHL